MSSACKALLLLCFGGAVGGCRRREAPDYGEVKAILDRHCVSCHAAHNTSKVFPLAPKGVELERPDDVKRHAAAIRQRTVIDRTMPLLNKTEMTDGERAAVDKWVSAGAPIP